MDSRVDSPGPGETGLNVQERECSKQREQMLQLRIQELTAEITHERVLRRRSSRSATQGASESFRLLVVANRLPMSLIKDEHGRWSYKMSSGGLVSALMGVKNMNMTWIGWPGTEIPDESDQESVISLLSEQNCKPVFLSQELIDLYYSGYANNVIWPLFHYIPLPEADLQNSGTMYEAYEAANQLFANAILQEYRPGDLVWIHDYHLMLLPAILRTAIPTMKIGFFLHTPFPSSEIYRVLPQREEIVHSLLSCDLIGFQVYDYCRHFMSSCTRILGLDTPPKGVQLGNGLAVIDAFPIGIDPDRFTDALKNPSVRHYIDEFKEQFKGLRVIVGIDRLDYIKGIPHKILAMEQFFNDNPRWVGKCVLVQIAVPSRTDVPEYQRLAKETHELVGRVNGRFGSISHAPIHYLDQSIGFDKMCALYALADICLITSLRDGMNLVSFEYIACQTAVHGEGVLILSEFCGASQSLGAGSIRINPWDISETSQAIQYSLEMSSAERKEYHRYAMQYVLSHTSQYWADGFVNKLLEPRHRTCVPTVPRRLLINNLANGFTKHSNGHRVLILGLVGTLVQRRASGMSYDRFQLFAQLTKTSLDSLRILANDPHTTIVILTSRNKVLCDAVLSDTPVWVGAENGAFLRRGGDKTWEALHDTSDSHWMEEVSRVFDYFTERTPKSFVEKEDTFLSWHYRDADKEFGELQARDLLAHLVAGPLVNTSTEVISSSKLVQVRPAGITKGIMSDRILGMIQAEHPDISFVMCLGDFLDRDGDIFQRLSHPDTNVAASPTRSMFNAPEHCHFATINVGAKAGHAKYFVRNTVEVEHVLRRLSDTLVTSESPRNMKESPSMAPGDTLPHDRCALTL